MFKSLPSFPRFRFFLPDCAVCSDGYAESLSFTCSTCSDKRARVVAMLVVPAVVILVLIFVVHMVSKEGQTAGGGRLHRLKQFLPFQSFKIVIVAWQIMTGVSRCSRGTYYAEFLVQQAAKAHFYQEVRIAVELRVKRVMDGHAVCS